MLVIGTIIVYQQLNYIQTKKLGFDKDQVLLINETDALGTNKEAFKNEIARMVGVKSAAYAGFLPVAGSARNDNTFSKEAVMDLKNGFNMQVWNIDYDYIPTLGMEIIKGRNLSKSFGSDSSAVIINETTAKVLGYEDPTGKKVYASQGSGNPNIVYEIVGVVKNFHYESLRQTVGPLCMRLGNNSWATAFKINIKDVSALVNQIEAKWKSMAPEMPFSYKFLDQSFDQMYRAEQRVGKVALTFAILTILIACLGLFGLVTYMAEQRTKEIGIRKVLGASVPNIVSLLSSEFLVLVVISVLIASPIAYYAMSQWLTEFAYRIEISWWMFFTAGVLAVCIALLTVSSQAIRAALMNPVNSLKSE